MYLKRKISILMLCLVIMGALSSNAITAKAVYCKHPNFFVAYDVCKEEYHDEYYHYIIYGTQYCCSCGYTYWEDLTLAKREHTWGYKEEIINGKKAEIIYCVDCDFVPSYYP